MWITDSESHEEECAEEGVKECGGTKEVSRQGIMMRLSRVSCCK